MNREVSKMTSIWFVAIVVTLILVSSTPLSVQAESIILDKIPNEPDTPVEVMDFDLARPRNDVRPQTFTGGGLSTNMTENFEGVWPSAGWQLSDLSTSDGGEFLWDKRNCHPHSGNYGGWSIGGGQNGTGTPCSGEYPNNSYTWAVYGPFDLSDATSASLDYHFWGRTEGGTNCPFDVFYVGSSADGDHFNGSGYCGNWTDGPDGSGYYERSLDLSGRLGEDEVWVAFVLLSDTSITYGGITIDDVALRIDGGSAIDTDVYCPMQLSRYSSQTESPFLPPDETDQDGSVSFQLPEGEVEVKLKDPFGQPVEGMQVTIVSNGEKILMLASDPMGRYVPTFQESDLHNYSSSAIETPSVPWHFILEVVHLAVEGKHLYELVHDLPDLVEYNVFYHEECWSVHQLATAMSLTGGIVGGIAGTPALGIVVGVGADLILPDLLTDFWCGFDLAHPMLLRTYHLPPPFNAVVPMGACPGIPSEDICTGRERSSLSGYVRNARNYNAIGGAYVYVEPEGPGAYSIDGGFYEIDNVPLGFHSVTASMDGFVDSSQVVEIAHRVEGNTADFLISPIGTDEELRLVLTWGSEPRDLDSHLWLPSSNPYHIYFGDEGRLEGFPYAELDVDDTSSYGPETITMLSRYEGDYVYAVYNYSGTGSIPTSGGKVEIYRGDTLLREVRVPTGGAGRWWNVCRIDGATGYITIVNAISNVSPGPY